MGNANKLSGKRFGRLIAIKRVGTDKHRNSIWECKCDCGNITNVASTSLGSQNTRSCGCLHLDTITTHGESGSWNGMRSKEYAVWMNMLARCYNENATDYHNYGGRGIKVCDRWKNSYENFLEDIGRVPDRGYEIERIDNCDDYYLENCGWATHTEQCRNKRTNHNLTFNGENICVTAWAERMGIDPKILFGRIRLGWSIERILTTPVRFRSR